MFVLSERPSTTSKTLGLLARKDGQYTRPIVGDIVDFRVEDFMPHQYVAMNILGRLPDIPQIGQVDKFFSSVFQDVQVIPQQEAMKLASTGQFLMLPDGPSSEFWKDVGAPWWEFAVVLDKYDGFIKAPARPRAAEPTAAEADERIDLFGENQGKVHVLAPSTLEKWATQKVTESYLERLKRI